MYDRTVLFTANAGFFITANGITLAVDAFPRTADRGFSALSEEHLQQLCQRPDLADVRYVIATHAHNDHYSMTWNEAFLNNHPQARFMGAVDEERAPKRNSTPVGSSPVSSLQTASSLNGSPKTNASLNGAPPTNSSQDVSPILLHGDRPTYYLPGITFEFLRLPHEGVEFAQVTNYGCLVTIAGTYAQSTAAPSSRNKTNGPCRILFVGDAKPADPAIAQWIGGRSIDLALLNFPWIALPRGQQFINEYLPHANIGVIHLPYETEDRNHYVAAAKKAAGQLDSHAVTLFTEYGQEMYF